MRSGLDDLRNYIETEFCKTIKVVIPPTPAPTPACGVDRLNNKDDPWDGCLGGLCRCFDMGNGSSRLCLRYAQDGLCEKGDHTGVMQRNCHCTCGRCCAPTPSPTPAPTDTDSPT